MMYGEEQYVISLLGLTNTEFVELIQFEALKRNISERQVIRELARLGIQRHKELAKVASKGVPGDSRGVAMWQIRDGDTRYHCSHCGKYSLSHSNWALEYKSQYCPHCGFFMENGEREDG